MGTGFSNFPFIEDNYSVGQIDISKPMTYKNRGAAFNDLPEPAEDIIFGVSIQSARWLIKNKYGSIPEESSCQCNLLPLAPTEFTTIVKQVSYDSFVTIRQIID